MAVDLNSSFMKSFGKQPTPGNGGTKKEDKPKAEFWMNVGYETGDPEYPFISLPMGIPLDTMERADETANNPAFAEFRQAQNLLLDQIMEQASQLQPGDSIILPLEGCALAVQIRRRKEQSVPQAGTNRFAKPLFEAPVKPTV